MINCIFENKKEASLRHVVVHAILEDRSKLLLVKRSKELSLEGGKWALPGGFLSRDETATSGVLRELKEETGWEGEVVALFRVNTNPRRPHEDRQNVALDFLIKPVRLATQPDREVTQVQWIDIAKLPPLRELAFDHGESIKLYLEYKANPFPLPLVV